MLKNSAKGQIRCVALIAWAALWACATQDVYVSADVSGSDAMASRTTLPADGVSAAQVTLHVRQHNGTPIPNVQVRVTGGLALVKPSQAATDANGALTVSVSSTLVGTYTIQAALLLGRQQLALPVHVPLSFSPPNTAVALDISTVAPNVTAGEAAPFTVRALDARGAVATGYVGTLRFTSSDPQATLPADASLQDSEGGVYQNATALRLRTAGLQQVRVSDGILEATLPSLVVLPAVVQALRLDGPSDAVAGVATPLTVTALDAFGNVASGYRGTAALTSDDAQAQLPGAYAFAPGDAGVSPPLAVTLKTAGTPNVQVADAGGRSAMHTVAVHAAAMDPQASSLQCVTSVPADGAPHSALSVRTLDAFGNPAANVPVALTATGLATALSPTSASTDGAGLLSIELASTVPQTTLVSANIGGSPATCSTTFARAPCFAMRSAAQLDVGHVPVAMALGDINRDGRLDVAVANSAASSVTLLMNQKPHAYTSISVPLTASPLALRLGDMKRDGRPDLVVATNNGQLTVLAQQADGSFASVGSQGLPGNATEVLLGDLNRDGVLDVVALIPTAAQVAVALGASGGTLSVPALSAVGPAPGGMALADINDDGVLDLLASSASEGAVSLLYGAAAGTFGARVTVAAGLGGSGVGAADMNADGRLDVVVANQNDNTVAVLLNQGSGSFATPSTVAVVAPQSLVIADMDGDALPDVAVASPSADSVVILGNLGGGQLAVPVVASAVSAPAALAVGDLERNGRQALAVLQPSSDQWILLANACTPRSVCNTFSAGNSASYSHGSQEYIDTADVNRDGRPDVIVTGTTAALFINQGIGALGAPVNLSGGGGRGLAPADYNRDGKPDIAFAHGGSGVTVMLNNGTGGFPSSTNYPGGTPFRLVAADLDGDGDLDLVSSDQGVSNLYVFINNGSGTFANGVALAMAARPVSVAVGDMNGDGTPDLVPTLANNSVQILPNHGNATFGPPTSYPTGQIAGYENAVLADLDRDGQLDLAQVSNFNAEVEVLLNTGGAFAPYVAYRTNQYPYGLRAGDLNGDGFVDLAIANYAPQTLTVLINAGNGTFDPMVTLLTAGEQNDATIADMDADGRPDVVGANDTTGGPLIVFSACP